MKTLPKNMIVCYPKHDLVVVKGSEASTLGEVGGVEFLCRMHLDIGDGKAKEQQREYSRER